MTTKSTSGIAIAIVAGLLIPAVGCQKSSGLFSRSRTEQYETVSEGTASGVSSTIAAPGETAPPLVGSVPLTNTNVDTTTSLTIGTDVPMATGTPAPAASTYTPSYGGYSTPPYGTPTRSSASPQPATSGEIHIHPSRQPDTAVQPTTTQPTTTQVTPTTTVNTTTIDPTTTQPDGRLRKDKQKDKKPQPDDEQQTDTAPPPPTETSDTTSAT